MSKKRILIVAQEMLPYTEPNAFSELVGRLPLYLNEKGYEIRVLMPRFGMINERRHRLHEVVRLSGMNIIVDDDDYPLIIKVASLPGARLQVYFLDNEEFFKRKEMFEEEDGTPFEDNAERMVFFSKGVIETVRKFGWPPDIIHCHGWMTSLVPMFIKQAYKNDPVFSNTNVVYSAYEQNIDASIQDNFITKASINNIDKEDLNSYFHGDKLSLDKGAIKFADGVIKGSNNLSPSVLEELEHIDKPILEHLEGDGDMAGYVDFYKTLMAQSVPS